jgi:precorrin-3B C17-methyltransferase/precorrin-6Y C5,15-methyltransferase (decarboxylating) CbiT subunit
MTPAAQQALHAAQIILGYQVYIDLVQPLLSPDQQVIPSPIGHEIERAELAVDLATSGRAVAMISSGDIGIYAMAGPVFEVLRQQGWTGLNPPVEVFPGVSAIQAAAARLGAPLGHDFCTISLSDLLTPWPVIERRLQAAAWGDFVIGFYNPRSQKRDWQLQQALEILLAHRAAETPVAIVRHVTRPDEQVSLTTLAELQPEQVDMFTLVLVGNSQSYRLGERLVTPRGYMEDWKIERLADCQKNPTFQPSPSSASLRTGPPALRLRSGQAFQPFGFAQDRPSSLPTFQPSNLPAFQPSSLPTFQPSNPPAFQPSNPPAFQISPPGLPDAAFSTAANQITKREIRLLVLAELALCPGEIMWDIGTGSGSVSLEAARAVPAAMVYAIEKRAELLQHARENLARFPAPNVHLMEGVAPDDLGAWPDPDAVFIGGSGGRLAALIEATQRRLRAGGRLVINLATVENLAIIRRLLPEAQVNQIQINRGVPIMDMLRFEALNPVFIVKWRLDNR